MREIHIDDADEKRETGSAQTFVTGLVVGGAIGAALALLYAPKKGSELRSDIASKVGDLGGRFSDALKSARTTAEEMMNEGKERGDKVVQEALLKAENLIDEADRIISEARGKKHH